MAGVFPPLSSCCQTASLLPSSLLSPSGSGAVRNTDIVNLTAAVFLVLCRRCCPGSGVLARPGGAEGVERASSSGSGGGGGSIPDDGRGPPPPPPMFSETFVRALDAADASCSRWVPRFHPHELLEADLQACRDELDGLALALERRVASVDSIPGGDLARMTVVVLGGGRRRRCGGDTQPGTTREGEAGGNAAEGGPTSTRPPSGCGETGYGEDQAQDEHSSSPVDRRLVLTMTDSASRLVPPRPPEATGSALEQPPKEKKDQGAAAAAGSGVFAGIARVNEALREHALRLADRFNRTAAHCQQHRETGTTPTSTPASSSAFAAHYSCKRSKPEADPSWGLGDAENDKARRLSRSRRISPPTSVIAASLLPQISCVSGLCRGCAEVARGLRERLAALEALLAAGEARSKQRRAYATLLRAAPALLRFLASAVAAVELFVIEWDQHTTPPPEDEGAVVARAAGAGAGPPDAAAGLAFLRRLAAVTGTLCVTPGELSKNGGPVRPGGSTSAGMADRASVATCKKKGFAQALAELASFLETKTARQGFARCSC